LPRAVVTNRSAGTELELPLRGFDERVIVPVWFFSFQHRGEERVTTEHCMQADWNAQVLRYQKRI
jgi:hypothetical protein